MHPLKFITQVFNIPLAQVADQLGIKRQSVNEWVGKRQKPIPKKHISKLAELFGVEEEWFEKSELKQSEQIEIQRIKLNRDTTWIEYPDSIVDDEGNVHEITNRFSPEEQLDSVMWREQRVAKIVEEIDFRLSAYPEMGDDTLNLFESIIGIIASKDYAKRSMLQDTVDFLAGYDTHGFGFLVENADDYEAIYKIYKKK